MRVAEIVKIDQNWSEGSGWLVFVKVELVCKFWVSVALITCLSIDVCTFRLVTGTRCIVGFVVFGVCFDELGDVVLAGFVPQWMSLGILLGWVYFGEGAWWCVGWMGWRRVGRGWNGSVGLGV